MWSGRVQLQFNPEQKLGAPPSFCRTAQIWVCSLFVTFRWFEMASNSSKLFKRPLENQISGSDSIHEGPAHQLYFIASLLQGRIQKAADKRQPKDRKQTCPFENLNILRSPVLHVQLF